MSEIPTDFYERIEELKFDTCAVCFKGVEILRPPHDMFFSHLHHPEDGHEAVPLGLKLLYELRDAVDEARIGWYKARDKADLCDDVMEENARLVGERDALRKVAEKGVKW
jgi:hypothetical protein